MYRAKIHITLKPTVMDAQGTTAQKALRNLGFAGVENVRIGKYVTLDVPDGDRAQAEAAVTDMCRKLLANPVIEEFSFELEEAQ